MGAPRRARVRSRWAVPVSRGRSRARGRSLLQRGPAPFFPKSTPGRVRELLGLIHPTSVSLLQQTCQFLRCLLTRALHRACGSPPRRGDKAADPPGRCWTLGSWGPGETGIEAESARGRADGLGRLPGKAWEDQKFGGWRKCARPRAQRERRPGEAQFAGGLGAPRADAGRAGSAGRDLRPTPAALVRGARAPRAPRARCPRPAQPPGGSTERPALTAKRLALPLGLPPSPPRAPAYSPSAPGASSPVSSSPSAPGSGVGIRGASPPDGFRRPCRSGLRTGPGTEKCPVNVGLS